MSYIKFKIRGDKVGTDGIRKYATIARVESDMANTNTYELNIILHALAIGGLKPTLITTQFPYTFPFGLGGVKKKDRFPYTFPFGLG